MSRNVVHFASVAHLHPLFGTYLPNPVYARLGSWFSHQNDADAWPYKLVDTVLRKPDGFRGTSTGALPVSAKLESARIPRSAFKPLSMKAGETWSIYVCTSIADFRYTLGTSIGKTFASNSELKIMEGAGAADWPPFGGGDPATGGIEYTFYAPRVFNGRLRYDYVDECPSEAPSITGDTGSPVASPTSVTQVSYTFYIEHSPDILTNQISYDMSFGVRKILEEFIGGKDKLLSEYASFHDLRIDSIVTNVVLPSQIGCEFFVPCLVWSLDVGFCSSQPCAVVLTSMPSFDRPLHPNAAAALYSRLRRRHRHPPQHCLGRRCHILPPPSLDGPPQTHQGGRVHGRVRRGAHR